MLCGGMGGEGWKRRRVGDRMEERKSGGRVEERGEGREGLCSSKNSLKIPGPGPSLTLRQIDTPGHQTTRITIYGLYMVNLNQPSPLYGYQNTVPQRF